MNQIPFSLSVILFAIVTFVLFRPIGNYSIQDRGFLPTDHVQVYQDSPMSLSQLIKYRLTKGVFPDRVHKETEK